jgi:hypothetical protein
VCPARSKARKFSRRLPLVVPNQTTLSLRISVQKPLTALCRAPVSSTVIQRAVCRPARTSRALRYGKHPARVSTPITSPLFCESRASQFRGWGGRIRTSGGGTKIRCLTPWLRPTWPSVHRSPPAEGKASLSRHAATPTSTTSRASGSAPAHAERYRYRRTARSRSNRSHSSARSGSPGWTPAQ